jgi:HNH endonuclease
MIFEYPLQRHTRRHGPAGYKTYDRYKDWLRDEFTFRCVYCLTRERWYPEGDAGFSVDHWLPQVSGKKRLNYDNLLYACLRCNSYKRHLPGILNPCLHTFSTHLLVNGDGTLSPLTSKGRILVETLGLNKTLPVQWRREFLELFDLLQKETADSAFRLLFKPKFGFPDDLPDLRKRKPLKNSRPKGVNYCYYALWERDQLPEFY